MELAFASRPARSFSLRQILVADALTCGVFGLLLLAAGAPVAALLGLPGSLLFYAGVILLPCAALMALAAKTLNPALVWVVIAGNVGWVFASVGAAFLLEPSALGVAFVLVQAGAVAALAALEWRARTA